MLETVLPGTMARVGLAAPEVDQCPIEESGFRAIVETSLTAILVYRDRKLLYVNRSYAQMMGYASPQEALAQHVLGARVHPDDRPIVEARARARQAGLNVPGNYAIRVCRPDGGIIWIDCFANRINWYGEPALLAMCYDITARKLAEEALTRSERLFAKLFQFGPDPLTLTTPEGLIRDVNEAMCELLQRPRELVIGRTMAELGLWHDPAARARLMEEVKRSGRVRDVVCQIRLPSGELRDHTLSCELLDLDSEQLVLTVGRDVTERRRAEARIAYMAHHDALTGLPNRVLFVQQLEGLLEASGVFGVLCLDLDHFKSVNDSFGHAAGDALLVAVAARLRSCVRDADTVARLGGDEFAVIQPTSDQPRAAEFLAGRVVERLSQPFRLDSVTVRIGASVGIAVGPRDGADATALLRAADVALYQAKAGGRATSRVFHAETGQRFGAAVQPTAHTTHGTGRSLAQNLPVRSLLHYPAREAPAVHLRRAVIDAEAAYLTEDALHNRLTGHALAAEDLHAAVGHAPDRLGADHLRHRRTRCRHARPGPAPRPCAR